MLVAFPRMAMATRTGAARTAAGSHLTRCDVERPKAAAAGLEGTTQLGLRVFLADALAQVPPVGRQRRHASSANGGVSAGA